MKRLHKNELLGTSCTIHLKISKIKNSGSLLTVLAQYTPTRIVKKMNIGRSIIYKILQNCELYTQ